MFGLFGHWRWIGGPVIGADKGSRAGGGAGSLARHCHKMGVQIPKRNCHLGQQGR